MPSYVVTGASRGIGLEFVRQLSAIPENTVFAIVRKKATADKLTLLEGGNVRIVEADVTDHKALKTAAVKVGEVTGGRIDVLINNAAAIAGENDWRNLTDFEGEEELLEQEFERTFKTNVVGVIHSTNAFLPLIRKSSVKKVITISSAGGERQLVFDNKLTGMTAYGASKAAVNVIVAKYAAQLGAEGIIFIALRPGLVDVSATFTGKPSAKNAEFLEKCIAEFKRTNPNFPGMITAEESVSRQLRVIADLTEKENGAFMGI